MKILFIQAEECFYMPVNTKIPKRWAYLAEIATYVRNAGYDVKVMDCLDSKISHAEVLEEVVSQQYDLICFLMRIETFQPLQKLVRLIRILSPNSKLLTYGDAPCMFINAIKDKIPDLDAIVESGDWEVAIVNYAKYIVGLDFLNHDIPGITIKYDGQWKNATRCNGSGFSDWAFPDLDNPLVNNDLYLSITDNEVTISVSRGCPYNCKFCLAVKTFDKNDRRKGPEIVVDYMIKNRDKVSSFKLFSPTFTFDESWVEKFCNLLIERDAQVSWVTTSRPDCLRNETIIKLMSEAGCKRIAVGVETLDENSNRELGKFSTVDDYEKVVEQMFSMSTKYGIEIKPLLMLGIHGQTKESIDDTILRLKAFGAEDVRMAAYSPRHKMTALDCSHTLSQEIIDSMDKMTYINELPVGMSVQDFLLSIYDKRKR